MSKGNNTPPSPPPAPPSPDPMAVIGPMMEYMGAMMEQFQMATMALVQNFQMPPIEQFVPEYEPPNIDWEARREELRQALENDPNAEWSRRRGYSSTIRGGSLLTDEDDPDTLDLELGDGDTSNEG